MQVSGFVNAPVSKALLIGLVTTSILATITDTKYYFWISVRPHITDYRQYWRLLTWQLCYTNSTEVLFACMTLYQLRIIERLWGTRKFASFILSTLPYTTLLPPLLIILVLRPLSFGRVEYLPAGPTPVIFALLAQYHAAIPYMYKYQLSSNPTSTSTAASDASATLTSKSTSYLLPAQLALSQLPGSAVAALVGWVVGVAYRRDLLPGSAATWRVPDLTGQAGEREQRYEGLRRRMEGEVASATGTDIGDGASAAADGRRRGFVRGVVDRFTSRNR